MISFLKNSIFIFLAFIFSACSLRPDMPKVQTSVELNSSFDYSSLKERWWEEFGDEGLNALIKSALEKNSDLLLASNALEQARISLRLANLEFLPTSYISNQGSKSQSSGMLPSGQPKQRANLTELALGASWEIDLWGRVRNTARASNAIFEASEADYANARLSIAASVASTYFALSGLMEQERVLLESVASYEATLAIRKAQLESGEITELVYYQSAASVESAKKDLATLQDSIAKTSTALAILVGKDSDFILKNKIIPSTADINIPEVPSGINADILERRADVLSALKRLKAANARIGVARAEYFPKLSLTAMFGFSSAEFDRLIVGAAQTWSVAKSISMPFIDFGRVSNNVKLAWLDQNASMIEYDKTLRTALGEVKDALDLRQNASERLRAAQALNIAQNKVYELSKIRYEAGYSSHLELLDAQRMSLAARLELASAKANIASSVTEVFKALGGGFKSQNTLNSDLD